MKDTWVVAAESSRARIFRCRALAGPYTEIETLAHEAGREHSRDLKSDRPGRSVGSHGGQQHAVEPPTDPHRHERAVFAAQIAERLEHGRVQGEFADLVLVAPPAFLGELRAALGTDCSRQVRGSLDKDLVREPVEEIARHVAAAIA